MRGWACAASLIAACGSAGSSTPPPAPPQNEGPPGLGPAISQAQLDALLADGSLVEIGLERVGSEEMPEGWMLEQPPIVRDRGEELLVTECTRRDGPRILLAPGGQVYVLYDQAAEVSAVPALTHAGLVIYDPTPHCELARYALDDGRVFAGALHVE